MGWQKAKGRKKIADGRRHISGEAVSLEYVNFNRWKVTNRKVAHGSAEV